MHKRSFGWITIKIYNEIKGLKVPTYVLELLEDRHDCRATIVTSQLPVEHWHEAIGEPTLADAILDRLVHNAYKIALKGESMRKRQATVPRAVPAG